jgi:hypothetical protein
MPIRAAVQWAGDAAYDPWKLTHPQEQKVRSKQRLNWKPPSEGWAKCNVDGAFYADQRQGATGAVLRDHQGVFRGGGAKWYHYYNLQQRPIFFLRRVKR